jgi:hypothetical protein
LNFHGNERLSLPQVLHWSELCNKGTTSVGPKTLPKKSWASANADFRDRCGLSFEILCAPCEQLFFQIATYARSNAIALPS